MGYPSWMGLVCLGSGSMEAAWAGTCLYKARSSLSSSRGCGPSSNRVSWGKAPVHKNVEYHG